MVSETAGLRAKLNARTARQRRNVVEAMDELKQEEFSVAQSEAPRRTNFMANHMIEETTYRGYGYRIGFLRKFFVGLTNPVTDKVVTRFYALDVVYGTERMAGNNFLRRSRQRMRPRVLKRVAAALNA
jgi:hypothetical protein